MAGLATVSASALLLTACGAAPDAGNTSSAWATDYTGCIVSDSGGFDDQSFNQSSYEGLKKSEADLGIKVNQVESKTNNDFEPKDRKSTRLNSSHANISYAVFCLKKKNRARISSTR